MLKKLFTVFSVLIFLTGCSAKTSKEEIVFSSWGSVTEVKILKKIIADFEQENSDISVKFLHIPQNYFQKIHLLFASNTAPDVLFINNLNLPIYEKELEDLSNMVLDSEFYSQALDGLSYNDKLLAIPRDVSSLVFYVNSDIVGEISQNWDLDMLLDIAQKATKNNIYGISYEDEIFWAMPYLNYFGGGIFDKNYNLIIDNQNSRHGINFYKDLVKKYRVAPSKSQVGSSTLAQMFLDKKIGLYLSGRWMYPKITEKADFNWYVINFPEGKSPHYIDVSGWAISKNSKHKNSAKKFVNYLSSQKSAQYFAKTGLLVPANIEASKVLNNSNHNEKVFLDVIKTSQSTPVSKDYKKIVDKINKDLEL